jgi:hypothetical protein
VRKLNSLLKKPHAKDAKDAKKNSSRSLGDLCVRPFMVFQQPLKRKRKRKKGGK